MNEKKTIFAATGDSFITRRICDTSPQFTELASLISNADVRFTNLEVTVHKNEGIPNAFSGGTWAFTTPEVLKDLKSSFGFNLVSIANNHVLDYSYPGLLATKSYLEANDIVSAGAGRNLSEASEPKYLDTSKSRVSLIAVTSTFHESWVAGQQRADMIGRPGVNPLRVETQHVIDSEKFMHLKKIAETSYVNGYYTQALKDGYINDENSDIFRFGRLVFKEGSNEGKYTNVKKTEMDRILTRVKEATKQSDYVLISVHSHEMKRDKLEEPANFVEEFARKCVDAGAHAVIGHGPHVTRGIEIYKNRPIFYSLGNFFFQNETVTHLPSDYYEKFGLDSSNTIADAFDKKSNYDTRGLSVIPSAWESIVALWTMEEGVLCDVKLIPVEIGYGKPRYQRGVPKRTYNENVLDRIIDLSSNYGTKIVKVNGIGKVLL